jgi:hypothetical protein
MGSNASRPARESSRQLLRHTLATLAYRAGKALRDAPDSFAQFSTGEKGRTPANIVAHMGDLFDWALSIAKGQQAWQDSKPLPWSQEVERFFQTLQGFDDFLASDAPLAVSPEKLFQGPIADALPIQARLPFCAAWPAARFGVRTTSARRLPSAAWARSRPLPCASSDRKQLCSSGLSPTGL